MNVKKLYKTRFSLKNGGDVLCRKNAIWKVLCDHFFCKYIPPHCTVVDVGAGYCEFINNITSRKERTQLSDHCDSDLTKIAVDMNPATKEFAKKNVTVLSDDCLAISSLKDNSCDIIFMSNFLEHLTDKGQILQLFSECKRLLKESGRLLILQPNIKYTGMAYYDFFDHHLPLTDKCLVEGLNISGFAIDRCVPRFLPFSTKSRLPQHPWLVWLYLKCPVVWRIMGQQSFIVATPQQSDM